MYALTPPLPSLTIVGCPRQELHTVELLQLRNSSRMPVSVGHRAVGAGPGPGPVIVLIPQSRPPVGQLWLPHNEHLLSLSHHLDGQLLVLSALDLNQSTLGTKDLSAEASQSSLYQEANRGLTDLQRAVASS